MIGDYYQYIAKLLMHNKFAAIARYMVHYKFLLVNIQHASSSKWSRFSRSFNMFEVRISQSKVRDRVWSVLE